MGILVIRFSALGDVAMTVSVIDAYAREHPDVSIIVLTRERFVPLFAWCSENVTTIGVNLDEYKGLWGLYRLYHQITKSPNPQITNYTCVVDLHDVLRTKILRTFFRFSGVKVNVVNKGRKEKQRLIGHGVDGKPVKTMKDRYREAMYGI